MADNPYVNRVDVYNNGTPSTIIDLTQDTVTADTLLQGYTAHDKSGAPIIGTAPSGEPNLQAKTNVKPSTSSQVIEADSGYDGLSSVQIDAMPSGTAGTPTVSKGTVINHQVNVTPSVSNLSGYIFGGTKTGTAVTVTASELASGNLALTANTASRNCIGYATVSVNVPYSTITVSSSNPSGGSDGDVWIKTG